MNEPSVSTERQHGVLICPPIGQEHVRSHWALRQLATVLAREGFHVLRFDWYGVGDSGGSLEDTSVDQLLDDAETAAQELRDMAGLRRVSVVGLRLGASLAALAASRIDPYAMVLWDPVASGATYLSGLERMERDLVVDGMRFWWIWPEPARSLVARVRPDLAQVRRAEPDELIGFVYPAGLRGDITKKIVATDLANELRDRVTIVSSRDDRGGPDLKKALDAASVRHTMKTVDVDGDWDTLQEIEELYLPGETTKIVTQALLGESS